MERVWYPKFDGKQEHWANFSRTVKPLFQTSSKGPAIKMAQLKAKLPEEPVSYFLRLSEPAEAGGLLEKAT